MDEGRKCGARGACVWIYQFVPWAWPRGPHTELGALRLCGSGWGSVKRSERQSRSERVWRWKDGGAQFSHFAFLSLWGPCTLCLHCLRSLKKKPVLGCGKVNKTETEGTGERAVAIYTIPPSSLGEEIPKMNMFLTQSTREGGREEGEKREYRRDFGFFQLPPLPLQSPSMQWCAHPSTIILEAPLENCSSPDSTVIWFRIANKHDVVAALIAQTGMFLFLTSLFHTSTQFSHVCMWCWERRRSHVTAWCISDPCCFNYFNRGHRQNLLGQV